MMGYSVAIALGALFGLVSGMVPGLHVNLVAAILVAVAPQVSPAVVPIEVLVAFICAVAIAQTISNPIPGLFLGIPGDASLVLLPGHRLARAGQGLLAIRLSLFGSGCGLLIGLGSVALALGAEAWTGSGFLSSLDRFLAMYMFFILLAVAVILIVTDRSVLWSFVTFTTSGILGILVFHSPVLPGGRGAPLNAIAPALSGAFGLAGLLYALHTWQPSAEPQSPQSAEVINPRRHAGPAVRGWLAGFAVGLLPGLGGANAATLLMMIEEWLGKRRGTREADDKAYLVTTSALNSSEALIAIAALGLLNKSRSGASVAVEQLMSGGVSGGDVWRMMGAMIGGGALALMALWMIGVHVSRGIGRLCYPSLTWGVIGFIVAMSSLLYGPGGYFILVVSGAVGLIPLVSGVRRAQLMGFFMLPTMAYYSGDLRAIVTALGLESQGTEAANPSLTLTTVAVVGAFAIGAGCYALARRHYLPSNGPTNSRLPTVVAGLLVGAAVLLVVVGIV